MKALWVVAGGAPGETAHCTRCGEGLDLGSKPQRVDVALAAMRAFVKCHSHCKPGQHQEPAFNRSNWPTSRDTGTSSATIWHVFTGQRLYGNDFDVPYDPDDFGRCYRLLKLCPEWEAQLEDVAERFPKWKRFVIKWPKLKELYEEALKTGDGNRMYEFMWKLRQEKP
jgi:hypothetical protein